MNKKIIIVPIDFSSDSINALEHAIIFANKIEARIRMIHVIKSKNFEAPFVINEFTSIYSNSIEDFMNRILNKYQSQAKYGIDYKIRDGKIYKEICNQAKYDDAYLIVMGSHGTSGFEEKIIGSNAYRVVINAPCPIITIRNKFAPTEPQKIILPIDLTKDSRKKIPFIAEYALKFDSEIHIIGLHFSNESKAIKKLNLYCSQAENYFKEKGINKTLVHIPEELNVEPAEFIINYANQQQAQLIAIMTEQIKPLIFLLEPQAQKIIINSPIPVISFPPNLFS